MAFGWAYVDCSSSGGSGGSTGPSGSIQFMTGSGLGISTGSTNFTFQNNQILQLTGTLQVNGVISASQYHIDDISIIQASGSTYFGNSNDDVHARTGSLTITNEANDINFSVNTSGRTDLRQLTAEYTPVTTSPYTASHPVYILGVQANGQVNIQLPSPAGVELSGNIIMIKDELVASRGGDNITLNTSAGALIDGGSTYVLTGSMPAISLYSNGANWFVF